MLTTLLGCLQANWACAYGYNCCSGLLISNMKFAVGSDGKIAEGVIAVVVD